MESENKKTALLIIAILPAPILWALNGIYMQQLLAIGMYAFWLHDFLNFVVLPAFSAFLVIQVYRVAPEELGFGQNRRPDNTPEIILQTLIACVIFWYGYRAAQYLGVSLFGDHDPATSYTKILPDDGLLRLAGAFYFSVTAGISEELIFRAIPWAIANRYLQSNQKTSIYVICSSLVFASIHWENGADELLATFIVGIIACLYYLRTRWIIPLMIAHFLTDFIEFI